MNKEIFKEIEYCSFSKRELLASGKEYGYNYYILNLGTHPVAYIEIPKADFFYNLSYGCIETYINLKVNGGLTYSDNILSISKDKKLNGWFIGWDYNHYKDYSGYTELFPEEFRVGKKWTIEEILEQIKEACKILKEYNENEK